MPKGQFLRIKRNCAREEDFMAQINMMIGRFIEKGYIKQQLESTREIVKQLDRHTLFRPKVKEQTGDQFNLAFISGFHLRYKEVEKIIKKDPTLKKILPTKPKFIYRRAPGLRNMLVKMLPNPLRGLPLFWITQDSTNVKDVKLVGPLATKI